MSNMSNMFKMSNMSNMQNMSSMSNMQNMYKNFISLKKIAHLAEHLRFGFRCRRRGCAGVSSSSVSGSCQPYPSGVWLAGVFKPSPS